MTPTRRSIIVALATFSVGAALSVVGSAVLQPAEAREFPPLIVTQDKPTFASFDGIPESLAYPRKADPDFCRQANYCDTIPVQIPPPDVPRGAGYKLVFKADSTDGTDLDVIFWDNKQLKQKYGKCPPGETCYDPLETDYTDLIVATDPQTGGPTSNGVYVIGEPDLIDYNITVLNFNGTSTGYTIYMELQVEGFVPPSEVRPPDNSRVATPSRPITTPRTPSQDTPSSDEPAVGDPADLPALNDLLIERDPDLQAIQDQNLADQLKAPPSQISQIGRVDTGPPPPVSGLTLLLWLGVVPAGLAGGASTLVQRRRVQIPDLE